MPTEKVTMAVVAFFHLSAALISKPTQARRRAVGTSDSLCVTCADDGPVGAYEVYDGAGFLLSVEPEKAGVQFL